MATDHKARRLQALRLGTGQRSHWIWETLERAAKLLALGLVTVAIVQSWRVVVALRNAGERASATFARPGSTPAIGSSGQPRAFVPTPKPPPRGRPATDEDREAFSEEAYLAGSAGLPTPERVMQRVRSHFEALGVTDEPFLWMVALDEADRTYQDALLEALASHRSGDPAAAVKALQTSLAAQDARHLVARLRLLEALEAMAREVPDSPLARRCGEEADALRKQITETAARAAGPHGSKLAEPLAKLQQQLSARRELVELLSEKGKPMDALANLFKWNPPPR